VHTFKVVRTGTLLIWVCVQCMQSAFAQEAPIVEFARELKAIEVYDLEGGNEGRYEDD